ncbi:M14 family zinc carboxypeptidase [Haladaptatus sp. GCM10025707]|uniref:M14 family zinc carboxypeptidase n=1 Tax=unclassified Haladaptatus TaxID=2622732 RepID=UPI0023E79323|nr:MULTISPECIES: M14 family zinc carboxypeptidase [unclassified Haladaptatus]
MKRRHFLQTTGTAALGVAGLTSVSADPDKQTYRPGGPKQGTENFINLNAFHTNEELATELAQVEQRSDRISLREIGRSAGRNDPIWEVKVGEGDTHIHLVTQIHGDEAIGTEVALKLIKSFGMSNSKQVEHILDNLSFTIIPRINPDGAMYHYDYDDDGREEWVARRQNTQAWEGESRYKPYYHSTDPVGDPGYDMNRDFNIRPPSEFNPRTDDQADWWANEQYMDMPYEGHTLFASGLRLTPEVRAVTESFIEANPDYAITHHHKGGDLIPGSGDGNKPPKQTLMSVMANFGEDYLAQSPFFPDDHTPVSEAVNPFLDYETSTKSIKLNSLVIEALADRGNSVYDSITRYGYYPLWGSYLDALCPNVANGGDTAAGMLYEVAYQTDHLGQKAFGRQLQLTKVGFLESFAALADDPTLTDYSVDTYFDTPLYGEEVNLR